MIKHWPDKRTYFLQRQFKFWDSKMHTLRTTFVFVTICTYQQILGCYYLFTKWAQYIFLDIEKHYESSFQLLIVMDALATHLQLQKVPKHVLIRPRIFQIPKEE